MEYKHVLVGVDFSACSANALTEAVRLAAYDDAQVSVLHVIDAEVMEYLTSHTVVDEAQTRSDTRDRLEEFINTHGGDYDRMEPILLQGHPFVELIKTIEAKKADLLILGARGQDDDDRHLGAMASKCLRKAPLPVLLTQDRLGEPFQQLVCCVDFSKTSELAVKQAIHMAKLEQAALDFVHIYASPHTYQDSSSGYVFAGLGDPEDFARIMKQNLINFLAPFKEEAWELEVTYSTVDHLIVGQGIVDHLNAIEGDLLVMGTRGRTGWKKLLLGTTAEHVLQRAPCSTLTVKPEDFHFSLE